MRLHLLDAKGLHWIDPCGSPGREPRSGYCHASHCRDRDEDSCGIERAELINHTFENARRTQGCWDADGKPEKEQEDRFTKDEQRNACVCAPKARRMPSSLVRRATE
jgi:hypothetical protein